MKPKLRVWKTAERAYSSFGPSIHSVRWLLFHGSPVFLSLFVAQTVWIFHSGFLAQIEHIAAGQSVNDAIAIALAVSALIGMLTYVAFAPIFIGICRYVVLKKRGSKRYYRQFGRKATWKFVGSMLLIYMIYFVIPGLIQTVFFRNGASFGPSLLLLGFTMVLLFYFPRVSLILVAAAINKKRVTTSYVLKISKGITFRLVMIWILVAGPLYAISALISAFFVGPVSNFLPILAVNLVSSIIMLIAMFLLTHTSALIVLDRAKAYEAAAKARERTRTIRV